MKDSWVVLIHGPADMVPGAMRATFMQGDESPVPTDKELRSDLQKAAIAYSQSLGWTPDQVRSIQILGPMTRAASDAIYAALPGTPLSQVEMSDFASRLTDLANGVRVSSSGVPLAPSQPGLFS